MPLHFAYGSNMDERQMRDRCPSAEFKWAAKLEGWRLCFPRYSRKRHGGVASIEEAGGQEVWGVVFEIPEDEWKELDKSEGYKPGRAREKNSYQREEMNVVDTEGNEHQCRVYIANSAKPYKPSRECYLNYIIRGAEQHLENGIPGAYIEELRRIETNEKA